MKRFVFIAWEIGAFLVSITSRAFNAVVYNGSIYQTFSARCYWEAQGGSVEWNRRQRYVNRLFFWADGHCEKAWKAELARAEKTVAINKTF
jgi:hypothetical protein